MGLPRTAFSSIAPLRTRLDFQSTLPSQAGGSARCPVCIAKSFEEAVAKGFVRDFGRVIQLDGDGCFPKRNELSCSPSLKDKLQPVVDLILRSSLASEIRAIFVRGSVATGQVLCGGRSDLDLIVVSTLPISESQRDTTRREASIFARRELHLSGADVRFVVQNDRRQDLNWMAVLSNTEILQNNYSVLLYGDEADLWQPHSRQKPNDATAMNIRKDERFFIRLFEKGNATQDVSLQIDAIQWICKRALRAIADIASEKTLQHSRDLVPCFKLGSKAYPEYADTMLVCLQIACASPENGFAELSKDELLGEGYKVARNVVEIVEDLFLKRHFVLPSLGDSIPYSITSPNLLPTQSLVDEIREVFSENTAFWKSKISLPGRKQHRPVYRRTELPPIALDIRKGIPGEHPPAFAHPREHLRSQSLGWLLVKPPTPKVYRGVALSTRADTTAAILKNLVETKLSVQCRVSPDSTFIFCRGSHEWIDSKQFQPPSVLLSIPTTEAIARLQDRCPLSPLYYVDSASEQIYIQTKANASQQMFKAQDDNSPTIAQEERIWISTHGSVSGLHFDSSYSILVQRSGSKRMIFFPPNCLEHMGIYPLGHPLHRRARVCLTHRETAVFESFWESCPSHAVEVMLEAGDAVVFPPFWAHYTESLAEDKSGLSISHTLRYL